MDNADQVFQNISEVYKTLDSLRYYWECHFSFVKKGYYYDFFLFLVNKLMILVQESTIITSLCLRKILKSTVGRPQWLYKVPKDHNNFEAIGLIMTILSFRYSCTVLLAAFCWSNCSLTLGADSVLCFGALFHYYPLVISLGLCCHSCCSCRLLLRSNPACCTRVASEQLDSDSTWNWNLLHTRWTILLFFQIRIQFQLKCPATT